MGRIGVLVFPAGEVNSVELHDALSTCVNVDLYGASSIDKHGEYVFKNYISGLPLISEDNFFVEFNKILIQNKIDVVFPTHDTVAKFFADNKDKISARLIVADANTAAICRDKKKLYDLFQGESFCPDVFDNVETFPVFIKPREGQGSVGAKLLKTQKDIPENICWDKYVICEYLPGDEFTVDCFTDFRGQLKCSLPRSRKRLLAGISVSASDIDADDEFVAIAEKINHTLTFRGLWWFQVKVDSKGKLKLLEVSTRCAGTMCMARARGVNLALLSVYDAMEWDIDVMLNPYHITMDRTLISRYKIDYEYDKVYFDFDDTLIIKGNVHLPAISFLYQCRNQGKHITLLTKHITNIYDDMKQYNIAETLFDSIVILKPDESKAAYINPEKAIFIDNAFAERKEVFETHHIPVFDVDAIEVLQDWRI